MWQRFTERSRRIVFFAQEEAARLGGNEVGAEHLLLAVLRENDSVAARILDRMGISLDGLRSETERGIQSGSEQAGKDMQLSESGKRVIDYAYQEAKQLSNNYIGTEHILLGLIREGMVYSTELTGRVLRNHSIELSRTRREVMALQDNDSGIASPFTPPESAASAMSQASAILFETVYRKLPPEQQAALQNEGVSVESLPPALQTLVRVVARPEPSEKNVIPDPAGKLQIQAAPAPNGTSYTVRSSVTLLADMLVLDE